MTDDFYISHDLAQVFEQLVFQINLDKLPNIACGDKNLDISVQRIYVTSKWKMSIGRLLCCFYLLHLVTMYSRR